MLHRGREVFAVILVRYRSITSIANYPFALAGQAILFDNKKYPKIAGAAELVAAGLLKQLAPQTLCLIDIRTSAR